MTDERRRSGKGTENREEKGPEFKRKGATETQRERAEDRQRWPLAPWSALRRGPSPLPQNYIRRKADTCLGRGASRALPRPKYSMARWQEGCPRIRVFPALPHPIPGQGDIEGGCSCLSGGGGGAPPRLGSVHWVPSLTSPPFPPIPKHPACPILYQRDSV